jgi:hypothetical protein
MPPSLDGSPHTRHTPRTNPSATRAPGASPAGNSAPKHPHPQPAPCAHPAHGPGHHRPKWPETSRNVTREPDKPTRPARAQRNTKHPRQALVMRSSTPVCVEFRPQTAPIRVQLLVGVVGGGSAGVAQARGDRLDRQPHRQLQRTVLRRLLRQVAPRLSDRPMPT